MEEIELVPSGEFGAGRADTAGSVDYRVVIEVDSVFRRKTVSTMKGFPETMDIFARKRSSYGDIRETAG